MKTTKPLMKIGDSLFILVESHIVKTFDLKKGDLVDAEIEPHMELPEISEEEEKNDSGITEKL